MRFADSPDWYSRDYLPHFERPGLIQAITFRLIDSFPMELFEQWENELRALEETKRHAERQKRLAVYLDAGHGACWLRDGRLAKIVEDALIHFDGLRYHLFAWVIMPNHVHSIIEAKDDWTVAKIVQTWKTWTARECNKVLNREGSFWFREYHDRFIRDWKHFENAQRYVERNPVDARLCSRPEEWRWSSAWRGRV